MDIFDAAERYINDKRQTVIFGGKEYGSGSSRDWAERIHRSNLVGMGILPLVFINNENASSLGIEGS